MVLEKKKTSAIQLIINLNYVFYRIKEMNDDNLAGMILLPLRIVCGHRMESTCTKQRDGVISQLSDKSSCVVIVCHSLQAVMTLNTKVHIVRIFYES